jgi:hypothetical protein
MKLYWIKRPEHKDMYQEGYIGITTTEGINGRLYTHFNKLKNNSHPNPKLQNAYNKDSNLIVETIYKGSIKNCIKKEKKLRPYKNVGWNILEGGGLPPLHNGYIWFTNGKKNKLDIDCPTGYWPGRLTVQGENHGHYGKPKKYKTIGFKKGYTPWNKGLSLGPKTIVKCPNCNKKGGLPIMKRFHFTNCKEINNGK